VVVHVRDNPVHRGVAFLRDIGAAAYRFWRGLGHARSTPCRLSLDAPPSARSQLPLSAPVPGLNSIARRPIVAERAPVRTRDRVFLISCSLVWLYRSAVVRPVIRRYHGSDGLPCHFGEMHRLPSLRPTMAAIAGGDDARESRRSLSPSLRGAPTGVALSQSVMRRRRLERAVVPRGVVGSMSKDGRHLVSSC
jgi:hypothetical protein